MTTVSMFDPRHKCIILKLKVAGEEMSHVTIDTNPIGEWIGITETLYIPKSQIEAYKRIPRKTGETLSNWADRCQAEMKRGDHEPNKEAVL